jgi:FlaA1/EpsC-like NDP-sugar epimerase
MNSLSVVMKVISIVMTVLFIFSTLLLVVTFRKPKKFAVRSQILAIIISLLSLLIFSSLAKYQPPPWLWLLMVFIGLAIGIIQARTTRVYVKDSKVMSQNSVWYLVVWGGIFALNQLITIITNKPPDVTMALLIAGTATTWGTNGDIIRRFYMVRAGMPAAPVQAVKLVVPTQGSPVPKTAISICCPNCGAATQKGDRFCANCGRAIA